MPPSLDDTSTLPSHDRRTILIRPQTPFPYSPFVSFQFIQGRLSVRVDGVFAAGRSGKRRDDGWYRGDWEPLVDSIPLLYNLLEFRPVLKTPENIQFLTSVEPSGFPAQTVAVESKRPAASHIFLSRPRLKINPIVEGFPAVELIILLFCTNSSPASPASPRLSTEVFRGLELSISN